MNDPKLSAQVTRDTVLKLLSNEEVARVSNAEGARPLTEGQEFLDLENLGKGAQRAKAAMAVPMGRILPRYAVSDDTWRKILAHLAG